LKPPLEYVTNRVYIVFVDEVRENSNKTRGLRTDVEKQAT